MTAEQQERQIEELFKKAEENKNGLHEVRMEVALSRQRQMGTEKTVDEKLDGLDKKIDSVLGLLKEHIDGHKEKIGAFVKSFIAPIATALIIYFLLRK